MINPSCFSRQVSGAIPGRTTNQEKLRNAMDATSGHAGLSIRRVRVLCQVFQEVGKQQLHQVLFRRNLFA